MLVANGSQGQPLCGFKSGAVFAHPVATPAASPFRVTTRVADHAAPQLYEALIEGLRSPRGRHSEEEDPEVEGAAPAASCRRPPPTTTCPSGYPASLNVERVRGRTLFHGGDTLAPGADTASEDTAASTGGLS